MGQKSLCQKSGCRAASVVGASKVSCFYFLLVCVCVCVCVFVLKGCTYICRREGVTLKILHTHVHTHAHTHTCTHAEKIYVSPLSS